MMVPALCACRCLTLTLCPRNRAALPSPICTRRLGSRYELRSPLHFLFYKISVCMIKILPSVGDAIAFPHACCTIAVVVFAAVSQSMQAPLSTPRVPFPDAGRGTTAVDRPPTSTILPRREGVTVASGDETLPNTASTSIRHPGDYSAKRFQAAHPRARDPSQGNYLTQSIPTSRPSTSHSVSSILINRAHGTDDEGA